MKRTPLKTSPDAPLPIDRFHSASLTDDAVQPIRRRALDGPTGAKDRCHQWTPVIPALEKAAQAQH